MSIVTNNSRHYVNEVGSVVVVNTGSDITTATTIELHVKKPDGTIVVWIPSKYAISGDNFYLRYLTVSGDLDQTGKYQIQPYVVFPSWQGYGQTAYFVVNTLFS